jgi:hypothetical protein
MEGRNSMVLCEEKTVIKDGKKKNVNVVKRIKDSETGARCKVYFAAPKLLGEDGYPVEGDFVNKDGEHYSAPVRCLSKKMATVDGVDTLKEWRKDIDKFRKEELPNGEYMVMRCTYDPESVAEWDMATDWDDEKIAQFVKMHPYFIIYWQRPEFCESYSEEIEGFELLSDVSEII